MSADTVGPSTRSRRGLYGISLAAELSGFGIQALRLYERYGMITPIRTQGAPGVTATTTSTGSNVSPADISQRTNAKVHLNPILRGRAYRFIPLWHILIQDFHDRFLDCGEGCAAVSGAIASVRSTGRLRVVVARGCRSRGHGSGSGW